MDVAVHGAVGFGLAREAGEFGTLDDDGHGAEDGLWPGREARVPGWRRGVLVVCLREPGLDLVVNLAGGGERDPDGGLAEVPCWQDPSPRLCRIESQAEVGAGL